MVIRRRARNGSVLEERHVANRLTFRTKASTSAPPDSGSSRDRSSSRGSVRQTRGVGVGMKRWNRVRSTIVGALMIAASANGYVPAQADDKAGAPVETITTVHADGSFSVETVQNTVAYPCAQGEICLYENGWGLGSVLILLVGQSVNNFAEVPCPTCGPNKYGHSGTWNDQVSSVRNYTGYTWWWYFHAGGYPPRDNIMPPGVKPGTFQGATMTRCQRSTTGEF
jgi:hypothetical protein